MPPITTRLTTTVQKVPALAFLTPCSLSAYLR